MDGLAELRSTRGTGRARRRPTRSSSPAADLGQDTHPELAPDDRAKLAAELLASLDDETVDDAEVERLWSEETDRRAAQIASDEVKLMTWDHLVERSE